MFRASYQCEPRGPGNLREVSFKIGSDQALVTIGDVPQWVIDADLSSPYIVTNLPRRYTLLAAATAPNPAWVMRDELYTTIQIIREIDIPLSRDRADERMGWYDLYEGARLAGDLEVQCREHMDNIVALFVHVIGGDLIANSIYESFPTILRDGKPAQWIPKWREDRPDERTLPEKVGVTSEMFEQLDRLSSIQSRKTEAIGRWYWRSRADRDPFRSFMWSFAGLEVLARTMTPLARREVAEKLHFGVGASAASGPAVKELLWPTALRDEADELRDPERNLTFKFALAALTLLPDDANADVAKFKELQRYRNRIHGQHVDTAQATQLAKDAQCLLDKYTPLVLDQVINGD